jgi:hypothetical protein
MTTDLESEDSEASSTKEPRPQGWLMVAAVAAGSAIAGGLAAAWYYRNTLTRLRQAENESLEPGSDTSSEISQGEE